ncbi:MAG: hypothetical protein AB8B53_05140 [Flavobacteriales bacterium]
MTIRSYLFLLALVLFSASAFSQTLSKPVCKVDSYFFSDSTKIELFNENDEGQILIEIGNGNNTFFREYTGPFYVDQTKTVSCKITHPDYYDSKLTVVKVYKLTDIALSLVGNEAHAHLVDLKKGGSDLNSKEWSKFNESEVEFKLHCSDRKLVEIELSSYVNTSESVLPPKKVVLYAHLKNGKVVHVRSANTVGSFKKTEQNWSHVVRLAGKPKLKKILKKTEYFTLKAYAQIKNDVPQPMAFDEILAR